MQRKRLRNYLARNANTAFGIAHGFSQIGTYEEFARLVPLADYDAMSPWIDRVRQGESRVLTHEPVTHLVPTSGTTNGRKLIPFTSGLQREFNAAIAPWLIDLHRQLPALAFGPAYWSVTPALSGTKTEVSAVPVGFEADTAYLGGARKRLVDAAMAVPSEVQRAASLDAFRYATLLALLRNRDLRLISVWHPSFLSLLLDSLPGHWESLLADVEHGTCNCANQFPPEARPRLFAKPSPRRAQELHAADPLTPAALWPQLRLISCWGDGAARFATDDLRRRFPDVLLQPKGLIATEAFVTLPFGPHQPLAIQSHFFEFIDAHGRVCLTDALQAGEEYEVVVTTAGGLWRYRLGDRVAVTGFVAKTPSLRFIERAGNVSDRFGEKLSEIFVAQVLQEAFKKNALLPRFALLAPDEDATGCRYTLYLQATPRTILAETLDHALRQNPHYAYCRDLGQLLPVRVFVITSRGYETFAQRQATQGARLGDIKPAMLSRLSGWSNIFVGAYVPDSVNEPIPAVLADNQRR